MGSMRLVCDAGDRVRLSGFFPLLNTSSHNVETRTFDGAEFEVSEMDEYNVALESGAGERILVALDYFATAYLQGDVQVT